MTRFLRACIELLRRKKPEDRARMKPGWMGC